MRSIYPTASCQTSSASNLNVTDHFLAYRPRLPPDRSSSILGPPPCVFHPRSSTLRLPSSVFHLASSILGLPPCVFHSPLSVLRSSVLRSSVLRPPSSVFR